MRDRVHSVASVRDVGSLWGSVTPDGPVCPPLEGDTTADAVVIGAGFTGLSTALHLHRAGVHAVVLEAAEPGWGASGRNNGQVIPNLSRPEPDDIEHRFGEAGERFVLLLRDCASILFDLARELNIDSFAEAEQHGWIQPAHTPGRMKVAERRWRQWGARGAPVEMLDADTVRDMLGSDAWFGGWWNKSGGHVNPLALARGLARAAVDRGIPIYGGTPALAFEHRDGRWRVRTPCGTVSADALMLATNAYTGEFSSMVAPDIATEIVPVLSWQMSTLPLDARARATIIPGRQSMSDTHGELYFARWDARDRMVTGGAVALPFNQAMRMKPMIAQRLKRLWPQIGEPRFDHVWSGYVAMTPDFMPRFHQLGPNGWAWAGCNGRAVGLAVALGREFARAITGTPVSQLPMAFTTPRPLPWQGIVRHLASLKLMEYRRMDRTEV